MLTESIWLERLVFISVLGGSIYVSSVLTTLQGSLFWTTICCGLPIISLIFTEAIGILISRIQS